MTAGQHIDYEALELESKRGVIKACLTQIAQTGLLGDHHFYIAFKTQAPGAGLSKRLKEKYPREMTIVLQHRFWDLVVEDERFEVKLTFDGIPERLVVPFKAVKAFYDPSVPYLLQFEDIEGAAQQDGARRQSRRAPPRAADHQDEVGAAPDSGSGSADTAGDVAPDRRDRRRPSRPSRDGSDGERRPATVSGDEARPVEVKTRPKPAEAGSVPAVPKPAAPKGPSPSKPVLAPVAGAADAEASDTEPDGDKTADGNGAKIFDLSKFRGKK